MLNFYLSSGLFVSVKYSRLFVSLDLKKSLDNQLKLTQWAAEFSTIKQMFFLLLIEPMMEP